MPKEYPPWYEETRDDLDYLKAIDEKLYMEWIWYCRETLNCDPNTLPRMYLNTWMASTVWRRDMGG